MNDFDKLIDRLGYQFNDPDLLSRALTHRSASNLHNERMEFLGDAVLSFVISGELYRRFPKAREGEMSRLRAHLVKGERLSALAKQLELGTYLQLGSGELKSGGHRRGSILADAFEAIVGAIYLDGGIGPAQKFILDTYESLLAESDPGKAAKDPKTRLQEWLQGQGLPLPVYELIATEGQAHRQTFEVACSIETLDTPVRGRGTSRRKAEQAAAEQALGLLQQ
jgi:ribonuclease-3